MRIGKKAIGFVARYFSIFINHLTSFEGYAAIAGLAALALIITISVLSRFIFHKPIPWEIDASECLLALISVLGLAYAARFGVHIRADIITRHLSERWQNWFMIVCEIIAIIFSCILSSQLFLLMLDTYRYHVSYMVLPVPHAAVFFIEFLGFCTLAGFWLIDVVRRLTKVREKY